MPKTTKLRVTSVTLRGKTRWQVVGPGILAGPGKTRYRGPLRRTKGEAEADLYEEQNRLAALRAEIPELSAVQKLDATRAYKVAAESGQSLERLVILGLAYQKLLDTRKAITLQEAWKQTNTALAQENASKDHVRTSKSCLEFCTKYALPCLNSQVREIEADTIRAWLNEISCAPTTKAKWLRYAKLVVGRAMKEGYTDRNVFELVRAPKSTKAPVTYLTPAASHGLLTAATVEDLPVVALGLFAGLRPEAELAKCVWSDFDWERLEIHIAKDRTKTGRHRIVPMEPALIAWLDHAGARDREGPVIVPGLRKRMVRARVAAGIQWVPDLPRHTYATMWLALHQDKARLAEQMGNSEKIIDQHYRFPISKSVAAEFWAIRPATREPADVTG